MISQGPSWAPSSQPYPPPAQAQQFATPYPQPKIRLQAPDEPARRLAMPRPEDLGLTTAAATLDWNAIRQRLQQLGALSFRVDQLAAGGHRVTFLLPTADPRRTRQIETTAASEAAAVQLALERAELAGPPR